MDAAEFWARVKKDDATGCWEWVGARSGRYRMCLLRGKVMGAHRASWILTNGEIPVGLFVCHKCDNPPCVNPDHLFIGTHADNNRDMASKGRVVPPVGMRNRLSKNPDLVRGEKNGAAKLTQADVDNVKRLLSDGEKVSNIASIYSVSQATIYAISRGENWGERYGSLYRSLEREITAFGATRTMREWVAMYGVRPATIAARLRHGWSEESAVSLPTGTNLRKRRGDAHHNCKISDRDALDMKSRRLSGEPAKDLASEYGVSTSLVYEIATGKSRRHLSLE